jgi:hypothetical protein
MKVQQVLLIFSALFLVGTAAPIVDDEIQAVFPIPETIASQAEENQSGVEESRKSVSDNIYENDVSQVLLQNGYSPWRVRRILLLHTLWLSGAEVGQRDYKGRTPLHDAVLNEETDLVVELIREGADITARDNHGRTALHLAAALAKEEVVRVLIGAGADVNALDNDGKSAMHLAASGGSSWELWG